MSSQSLATEQLLELLLQLKVPNSFGIAVVFLCH